MGKKKSSDVIGPALLESLGISPDGCELATIHLKAGQPVKVVAKYLPKVTRVNHIILIRPFDHFDLKAKIKTFFLVERSPKK